MNLRTDFFIRVTKLHKQYLPVSYSKYRISQYQSLLKLNNGGCSKLSRVKEKENFNKLSVRSVTFISRLVHSIVQGIDVKIYICKVNMELLMHGQTQIKLKSMSYKSLKDTQLKITFLLLHRAF